MPLARDTEFILQTHFAYIYSSYGVLVHIIMYMLHLFDIDKLHALYIVDTWPWADPCPKEFWNVIHFRCL